MKKEKADDSKERSLERAKVSGELEPWESGFPTSGAQVTRMLYGSSATIYLDGLWTAEEFGDVLRFLTDIYSLIALVDSAGMTSDTLIGAKAPLHRLRLKRLTLESGILPLRVSRFSYGSPGSIDIVGIGKLAEVAKDATFGIADRFIQVEDRELERQKKRLENEALDLKNEHDFLTYQVASTRENHLHSLELEKRSLENKRLKEAVKSDELSNSLKEIELIGAVVKTAREAGLSEEQIQGMLKALIAKAYPVVVLVEEKKLLVSPN